MNLINRLLKQNKARPWLGAFKHSMGQIGIYVSFFNLIMLSITTYNTGWIQKNIMPLNFLQFLGIIAGLLIIALAFEYRVDMPNYFAFWNQQFWAHENPMKQSMDKLTREIEKLRKEVQELKDANKTLHY